MLEEHLSVLGLIKEEVKVYLTLLETGPITVGQLSKKLGKPRPTLYSFLKKLKDKGFVAESQIRGVRIYTAEAPERIELLFQREIERLSEHNKSYKALLPELKKKVPSRYLNPKFQLFEGEEGLQFVLRDMLLYKDLDTYAFWPIKSMVDILSSDFFRYHNKERIRNNIYTYALWPSQQTVKIKDHPYLGTGEDFKRDIRITPKGIDFSMGYWIYGDKVAFISSRKESFGFVIESKEMVEMLLAQFKFVWKLSKALNSKQDETESFLREL
jgi:sugar-specific transcriptional regulator TrmB